MKSSLAKNLKDLATNS